MKLFVLLLVPFVTLAMPKLRSASALKTQVQGNAFIAELTPGYHFNDKAPNGLQIGDKFIAPTSFEKAKLTVQPLPSNYKEGTSYLYVCDDAVTFCEMHSVAMGTTAAASVVSKTAKGPKESHGFIQNDFEGALKKAAAKNQNMIVDFGARWCPACLRLEKEIFSSKEFAKKTAKFIKVKLDVDVFSNAPILDKYSVKGFPTVVLLTSKGEEIIRFVDYQPMETIANFIEHAQNYPMSIADLEKAEKTPAVKEGLWKRYYYSEQFDKALSILETLETKPKEYLVAKIELASKDEKKKDQYTKTLKEAIKMEPQSSRSLVWRQKLIETLPEKSSDKEKLANEAYALTEKLLSQPEIMKTAIATDSLGEYTGLEKFYVALMNADVADTAQVKTQQAWELVIEQGKLAKISPAQPGASLRLLSAMLQAKKFDEALVLVNGLLKSKPGDGDLQRRKMRVLVELKKFDEAVKIGEVALKNSYGINEFYVVEPLAKAYIGQNQSQKAQALLVKYLSKNEINFKNMTSFKKKLETLNQTLTNPDQSSKQ